MDMFDVNRRDNPQMDQYMDPKKPPFGGPKEKSDFEGNKRKSLNKYQRIVQRNRDFEGNLHDPQTGEEMNQPNYDTTWKAVTRDRVSRDAKKKPTEVMYAKPTIATEPVEEGKIMRFEQFVNENFDEMNQMPNEAEEPVDNLDGMGDNMDETPDLGYEVDEEQLEKVMDEFGDDLNELIDKIAEEMEIEKEAVCDLLCAAVEKICKPEDEEEGEKSKEDEGEEPTTDDGQTA